MAVNGASSTQGKGGLEFYQRMDASSVGKDFTKKMTQELMQAHANTRYKTTMSAMKNISNNNKV
jgi:hypothetical protein